MADSALRSNTALHAKLTRYSTFGSQSRKYKTSGAAKPPSKRTRILAFGKASLSRWIRRRRMPTAVLRPGAFPGRNTAVTRYCSASWSKVRNPTIGRRSEERRVGKECRSRRSPEHEKKKQDNVQHHVDLQAHLHTTHAGNKREAH